MNTIGNMFDETLRDEPILSPAQVRVAHAERMERQERERVQKLDVSTREGVRSLARHLQCTAEPREDGVVVVKVGDLERWNPRMKDFTLMPPSPYIHGFLSPNFWVEMVAPMFREHGWILTARVQCDNDSDADVELTLTPKGVI